MVVTELTRMGSIPVKVALQGGPSKRDLFTVAIRSPYTAGIIVAVGRMVCYFVLAASLLWHTFHGQ